MFKTVTLKVECIFKIDPVSATSFDLPVDSSKVVSNKVTLSTTDFFVIDKTNTCALKYVGHQVYMSIPTPNWVFKDVATLGADPIVYFPNFALAEQFIDVQLNVENKFMSY